MGSSASSPSPGPGGALSLGLREHPSLLGQVQTAIPEPALMLSLTHLPPLSSASTLYPPPSPQLYLQARAPPEGDSDLATRLLTEPDVQKVPPWGQPAQKLTSLGMHPRATSLSLFCTMQGMCRQVQGPVWPGNGAG